jgi:hypothetical protein
MNEEGKLSQTKSILSLYCSIRVNHFIMLGYTFGSFSSWS